MLLRIALEIKSSILGVVRLSALTCRQLLVVSILLGFFPFTSKVSAQEQNSDVEVLRMSTDLVVFPIRVTSTNHQLAGHLGNADFLFKDADKIISSPYVAAGGERVAMVFAIDESGSLRDIVANQRDTALALFGRFRQESRIAVMRFGERSKLVASFDENPDTARAAFVSPVVRNERTAIFDAAEDVIKIFGDTIKDPAERRIVILFSDGLDNASAVKPTTVIERARAANVTFYVIHIPFFAPMNGHLGVRPPTKGFRELAEKTGGRYFLVGEKSVFDQHSIDLTPVFNAIETDLKGQYLLGFYVNEKARDGRRHEVSITVLPTGLTYSSPSQGFSKTHRFVVNLPAH